MFTGFVPLLLWPLGPVLLLAILPLRGAVRQHGWRSGLQSFVRSPAGLLLLLAIVPQQRYLYDTLLLWDVPRSRLQMLLLTVSSWGALAVAQVTGFAAGAWLALIFCYLPALGIVLWNTWLAARAEASTDGRAGFRSITSVQ